MSVKNMVKSAFGWGKAIIVASTFAIVFTALLLQSFTVSGSSMEPTLIGQDPSKPNVIGDHVLIYKSAYLFGSDPTYKDIVIVDSRINRTRTLKDNFIENPIISILLQNNTEEVRYWIKRVIGEAGDTLEFKDGKVYRNGIALKEDYIKEVMATPDGKFVVPENHVFVMGDNRNASKDSRSVGPVPITNILGKVVLRHFPLNKIDDLK